MQFAGEWDPRFPVRLRDPNHVVSFLAGLVFELQELVQPEQVPVTIGVGSSERPGSDPVAVNAASAVGCLARAATDRVAWRHDKRVRQWAVRVAW